MQCTFEPTRSVNMAALQLLVVALAAVVATATVEGSALQRRGPLAKIPTHCPAVDAEDEVVLLPHEFMCNMFYMCQAGEKTVKVCAAENKKGDVLFFDVETQTCQWRNLGKCKNPKCTLNMDKSGKAIKLPYGGSCTNYYDCEDGLLVVKVCPKGQKFDYNLRECRAAAEANCKPIAECDSIHKEPVEDSCGFYSTCIATKKVILPCPAGKFFSRALQDCVDKRDSDCGQKIPCSGTGKMPDSSDCTKYTQCVNGFVETKSCGKGLHFNPFAHTCQDPKDAGCDSSRPCSSWFPYHLGPVKCVGSGRSPNKCHCNLYKECVGGEVKERKCEDGLHFNPHAQDCMEPCKAFCEYRPYCDEPKATEAPLTTTEAPLTTTEAPLTTTEAPLTTTEAPLTTTEAPLTTTELPLTTTELPLTTKGEGPLTTKGEGPLITTVVPTECSGPHKSPIWCDCSVYRECVNGTYITKLCPAGEHFSQTELECMTPCLAKCDKKLECELTTTAKPPPVTHGNCSGEGKAPVSGACGVYTICKDGKIKYEVCEDDLHFSPFAHECMEPEFAGCEKCDCCEHPVKDECNGHHNSTDKCGHCEHFTKCIDHKIVREKCPPGMHFNEFAHVCQKICDARCDPHRNCTGEPTPCHCSGITLVGDPNDCTIYKECVGGEIKTRFCPPGQHFNAFAQKCDTPCKACCDASATCPPITPPDDIDCEGAGKKPHPDNCHRYFECSHGKIKEYSCPGEYDFNPHAQECQPMEEAGCDDRTTCAAQCVEGEIESHPCDCRLYIVCEKGEPKIHTCGRKHFNSVSKKCEHPYDADCDLPHPAFSAECVGSYKVPHEDSCTSFYECNSGVKVPMECPLGTAFSTSAQACLNPADPEVDCLLD